MVPIGKINPIFTKIAFPLFSSLQGHSEKLKTWYEKLSKVILLVNTPIYFLLSFLSFETLAVFYGSSWTMGASTLSWMAIVVWIKAFSNPGAVVILAKGKSEIGFYWNLAWAFVVSTMIWVCLQMYPELSTVGWAQLTGLLPLSVVWHIAVKSVGKFSYGKVSANFFRITLYNIFALSFSITALYFFPLPGLQALLLGTFAFGFVYIVIILIFEKRFILQLYKMYF
jgi:O-antigen/teichoic acid export membrane protein